jgi:hypothetical protein
MSAALAPEDAKGPGPLLQTDPRRISRRRPELGKERAWEKGRLENRRFGEGGKDQSLGMAEPDGLSGVDR